MQSMPQSFRALADRVGEVADLLSHAQADLPNWWKGPAAKQAAASLGRAAAEAREFQGSALAAASAVSRCAQVVAAQQDHMMDVPDVKEPGVTDVVQRPVTPFEVLESARQDTAYLAAHQQAVQVVNGIAAQYVETRDELATITTTRGENFTTPTAIQNLATREVEETPTGNAVGMPNSGKADGEFNGLRYEPWIKFSAADNTIVTRNQVSTRSQNDYLFGNPERRATGEPTLNLTSREQSPRRAIEQATEIPSATTLEWPTKKETTIKSRQSEPPALDGPFNVDNNVAPKSISKEPGTKNNSFEKEPQTSYRRAIHSEQEITAIKERANPKDVNQASISERRQINTNNIIPTIETDESNPHSHFPPFPTQPQLDDVSSQNAAMIPPYTGVGSVGRVRERSLRPAYLKERKSAWLPDTVAAPADGVIRPD